MASSGTYAWAPSNGDLVLNAFGRAQIRRSEITQQHLADAAMEANLVQVEFSNRQPNLWTSELYEVALTQGTATYTLPARMIAPMAVYMTTDPGNGGDTYDRILTPLSTYEYAAIPDKATQAPPTSYWYNRQIDPQMTLWQVPDGNATYTLKLQILSQIEDASIPSGVTPNLPYRWLDAFAASLAARLARIYPAQAVQMFGPGAVRELQADAERSWQIAAQEDTEDVPLYVIPGLSGYYR